jgi:outer membrane lipoprotein-sorting protein
MYNKKIIFTLFAALFFINTNAQDAAKALVLKVKEKLDKVNDYTATGNLKTDVAFLKIPVAKVNIYFKKPNRFKVTKLKGISIMPKGGMSINMQNLLMEKDFIAIDAGAGKVGNTVTKIIKLLPSGDGSDIVLTTLHIDEKNLLILKASTTTKENGSFDIEMTYGKYKDYGLADKTVFSFNTKDYKLPKGVTLEFDDGEKPDAAKLKNRKGTVVIKFDSYVINKGVPDAMFK